MNVACLQNNTARRWARRIPLRGNQEPYRRVPVTEADVRSGLTDPILDIRHEVGAHGQMPVSSGRANFPLFVKVVGRIRYEIGRVASRKGSPFLIKVGTRLHKVIF